VEYFIQYFFGLTEVSSTWRLWILGNKSSERRALWPYCRRRSWGSIAYIIPAYQVFRDIERRLGSQVTINSQEIRNALRKSEIESAPCSGNQSSLIIESESQPGSPLYSNETNVSTSSSLIISLSAYSHVFQPNTGKSTAYTHSDSSLFSPSTSTYPDFRYHTSDIRPILGYHNSHNSRPILDSR